MAEHPDPETIRSLVHRYFARHSARDWPGLSALFTPDVTLTHPVYPKSAGIDAVGRFFNKYIPSRFLTYYEHAPNVIVEGNQAAAEWIFEVTRLDGRPAVLTGMTVLEFEGERIRAIKIFTDPAQLGSSPA